MFPTNGLIDHVTAVLLLPVTLAVYCCVWPALNVALAGLTETLTGGTSVMLALALLVVSAALVAFTVTLCSAVTEFGAAYNPLVEIVPTAGFTDQVTPLLDEPLTVAVNW